MDRETVDAAYGHVVSCMKPEARSGLAARYEQLLNGFNYDALDHCLRHYIWAELDAKTPGMRGLGRVSTDTPRLAAHYRQQFGTLDQASIALVYHGIQRLILASYMTYALLADGQPTARTYRTADELYGRWLPLVYVSAGKPQPGVLAALDVMAADDYDRLTEFMQTRHMRVDETTGKILYYYCVAGVNLRHVETI